MNITKKLGFVAALLVSASAVSGQSEEARRVSEATVIIGEMMAADDKAVPRAILEKAEGIAVFPSLLKGGLIVGGQRRPRHPERARPEKRQLVSNQFKIGADASVAAGPVGRDASASTDIQMRAKILSYSRTRGLFAGVTINGTTIRQDRDANERFYGTAFRTGQIVFDGLGGAPDPVAAWRTALAKNTK